MKLDFHGRAALLRGLSFWRRGSAALPSLTALILFLAVGKTAAETTNTLSEAEIQGRDLAQQLCSAQPAENFTNTGALKTRNSQGVSTTVPVKFKTIITESNWLNIFQQLKGTNKTERDYELMVKHVGGSNEYVASLPVVDAGSGIGGFYSSTQILSAPLSTDARIMVPFVGSDFWLADLGLEFFHWPEQKILPKTTSLKRGRAYTLLESTNPNPSTNGYSRVVSWIDKESGGILEAEAYDTHGKLLKVFAPKSFKKVNGQWQLQEMEIRNVQTGSRTRLEFDLGKSE